MARLEETQRWRDLSGGNIQKVSSDITIANSVPFSMNLIFSDIIGEAVSRKGTGLLSTPSAGNTCLGLYNHIDSTPADSKLFAAFNGTIYDAVSGASSVASLDSSAKCRFTTFLNTTLMLNGVNSRSYAGGNWSSSGGLLDVGNVPNGGQFPIEFKDRVYCAVTDRLYYTNTSTSGSVSWTAAGSGSLQAEQEDGGGTIQGLSKVPGYLMIYKQRSLKRWNFDSSFPEDLVNIGTNSNESIVTARGNNYFFYNGNFYKTNGGFPIKISRPIQRIIDGISSSFYSNVNGWSDNDDINWSIGDITVNFDRGFTETYKNVVLRFNIDSEQFAPLSYEHEFRFLWQYISGNDTLIVGGDTAGQVLQLDTGNTDYSGAKITYILQSPEFSFGARELRKTISEKIYVHSDGTHGAELQARLDYGNWQSIGGIKDIVTPVQIQSLIFYVAEFRIVDSISGEQIKLRGLDFGNVNVLQS